MLVELLSHIVTNDVDKNDVENILCVAFVERRIDSLRDHTWTQLASRG